MARPVVLQHARAVLAALVLALTCAAASAQDAVTLDRWVEAEFQPSTLTLEAQRAEMTWFQTAAAPLRGTSIRVATPLSVAHDYEARVLAKAFTDITGIVVSHEILSLADIRATAARQLADGSAPFAALVLPVADGVAIGADPALVDLAAFAAAEGREVTNPGLDRADLAGGSPAVDGEERLLPNLLLAGAYWFRRDLFEDTALGTAFQARFGYPLGVPLDWSAYADIMAFFTDNAALSDKRVRFGHAVGDPLALRRETDFAGTWLPLAGAAHPRGIRLDGCAALGASADRGGEVNAPVSAYALTLYRRWLAFSPPPGPVDDPDSLTRKLGAGDVAQTLVWPVEDAAELVQRVSRLNGFDGRPRWSVAPPPAGAYAGERAPAVLDRSDGWVLFSAAGEKERKAAWLYAQFTVSRSVSLRKSLVGVAFSRWSDLDHPATLARAPLLGGVIELYRGMKRGARIAPALHPAFASLSSPGWLELVKAPPGSAARPQLDDLAARQDSALGQLAQAGQPTGCVPRLATPGSAATGARLAEEQPRGRTQPYEALMQQWVGPAQ